MTLTKSKYYFEALDYFPFNLSECMDALNYALSYEPEDADSLCLMGRVYSEELKDYERQKNTLMKPCRVISEISIHPNIILNVF